MSWSRFDDNWVVEMATLGLNSDELSTMFALVQWCSRSKNRDGRVKAFYARSVWETPDPDAVLARLASLGLLTWDDGYWVVNRIAEHIPPLNQRPDDKKTFDRDRKRRQRAHAAGDHSLCSPSTCPSAVPCDTADTAVTDEECPTNVTRDPGTGRDWTGQVTNRSKACLEEEEGRQGGTGGQGDCWPAVRTPPVPSQAGPVDPPVEACQVCGCIDPCSHPWAR